MVFVWLAAALLLPTIAFSQDGAAPQTENVIIVVIDGVRYTETFGDPLHRYIPNIWYRLRPQGAIGETITDGAHASMLTGNDCWIWHGNPIEGIGITDSPPATPTLFEYFRAATGAGASEAWMIANHRPPLETMISSTHPDYGSDYTASWLLGGGRDRTLWRQMAAIMNQHHPRLMVVNFHEVDKAAHVDGWREYTASILRADRIVYEIWRKIQRHPFYANRTTLIVTSDHGRHTDDFTHHGDCCEGCQHVMFLVLGPDTRRGHRAGAIERDLHDIGATAGFLLGLPMPHAVDGEVMHSLLRDGVTAPEPPQTPDPVLLLDIVTVDSEGQPRQIFWPGESVGVEFTVCNTGALDVEVFQLKVGIDTCSIGRNYRNVPIGIATGECYTETEYHQIPLAAPNGEWSFQAEGRGLDGEGNVVTGEAMVSVTIEGQ
jgi:hypothetical protein